MVTATSFLSRDFEKISIIYVINYVIRLNVNRFLFSVRTLKRFLNQLDYSNIMCHNHFDEAFNTINLDLKVFQVMVNVSIISRDSLRHV